MTCRPLSLCRAVIVAAFCAAPALAQVIVDPGGQGQFRDLQTAINTVPAGTVLVVRGGTFGPLVIPKTLTIMGDPSTTITSPNTFATFVLPSAITLQGGGDDRLVLSQITVQGEVDGSWYNRADPSISGSGFSEVRVHDSAIHAPNWINLTGFGVGTPAISLGSAKLVVSRSDIRGSDSEADPSGTGFAPDGPHGVSASTVIALQSTVRGGGVGISVIEFGPPATAPCPCYGAGQGGPGIVATQLFDSASVIEGGTGSTVYFSFGFGGPRTLWGKQPNGPPIAAGTQREQIPATLFLVTPPRVGQTQAVWFNGPGDPGVLGLGALSTTPFRFGSGWFFLDPQRIYGVVPFGPFTLVANLPIPPIPELVGFDLSLQAVWVDGTLSNPVTSAITY